MFCSFGVITQTFPLPDQNTIYKKLNNILDFVHYRKTAFEIVYQQEF